METPNKETKYIIGVDKGNGLSEFAAQVNVSKEEMLKASAIQKDMQGYKVVENSTKVNGVTISDLCPKPTS